MTIIGVDPGLAGGLAAIYNDDTVPSVSVMPVTGEDRGRQLDLPALSRWIDPEDIDVEILVYLELVHSMPKQGVASTFKFGTGYGAVQGICAALKIPVVLISPVKWKSTVLTGLDWRGNKAASVQYCQRRWPNVSLLATARSWKPHDGIADALCIAEYGRMRHGK